MATRKRAPGGSIKTNERLRAAGLRPTRQRRALAELLFQHGHRHVTAELLHQEAKDAGYSVSLATVYNALHQFTQAGLLQQVIVEPSHSYFDTNVNPHQHFYDEADRRLTDISADISVSGLPQPPKGTKIERVDVVVRIRRA
ncbi:MAG TPA: Fur family transcriptional regulator [Rhizomicrobium sp.]|jgi:Fur family iron response transcriptional regulator|nr:Fur family transcriptional regulator [Rhizomicrobium sp.]